MKNYITSLINVNLKLENSITSTVNVNFPFIGGVPQAGGIYWQKTIISLMNVDFKLENSITSLINVNSKLIRYKKVQNEKRPLLGRVNSGIENLLQHSLTSLVSVQFKLENSITSLINVNLHWNLHGSM